MAALRAWAAANAPREAPETPVRGAESLQEDLIRSEWEQSEPIDGEALADRVAGFLHSFVAFPTEDHLTTVTLWTMHAHAISSAESTPRLAFLSDEPGCGKTRTLEVLELLTPNPRRVADVTGVVLLRMIAAAQTTLLVDEVDVVWGGGRSNETLRGVINAGHRRGASAYRCKGKTEIEALPAFAATALAGIGFTTLPPTIKDRAIVVPMSKPRRRVDEFRLRDVGPEAETLRTSLAEWERVNVPALRAARPDLGDIRDRRADCWEPLLAIGEALGKDWTKRAQKAAEALEGERLEADRRWSP
jgi:hypothetical protein